MKQIFKVPLMTVLAVLALSSCSTVKKTMWVSGYKTSCDMGAGKGQCLVVNQSANDNSNMWENFYAPIQGFAYKEGVMQKIRVKESKIDKKSTAQDQSNIRYELVKVEATKPDPRTKLQGEWYPVTINGNAILVGDYMPQLVVDLTERRAYGTDGCNNYTAMIKDLSLSLLKLGPIAGTQKACPDMNLANLYTSALATVEKYRISDKEELTLIDDLGKERMTLKRGEAYTKNALSGAWILVRLDGQPLNRRVQLPTLEINLADMKVFGSDGCNNYMAPLLNASNNALEFGLMASTKKACSTSNVAPEFIKNMEKAKTYTIDNEIMIVLDENGTEVLAFMRRR